MMRVVCTTCGIAIGGRGRSFREGPHLLAGGHLANE